VSLGVAVLLTAASLIESVWFPLQVPSKGSRASFTIRARQDAVFDLHETFVAEAREAKQAYVPIYNKDNQLLFVYRERIVTAALAEPLPTWRWSPTAEKSETPDGGVDATLVGPPPPPPDAGPPGDAGADAGAAGDVGAADAKAPAQLVLERRRELEALIRGCVSLLIPFYQVGVVDDSEFPKEKSTIRVFSMGRYVFRQVDKLHRFSSLRPGLEKAARQFFFKTNPQLLDQVIDYILQRLPPNLTYAKENERFVADISHVTGVKVVLIRRGDILVRRGHVVDTRAYYAIRASVAAARGTSMTGLIVGRLGMLISLLFLFIVATREFGRGSFKGLKPYVVVFIGLLLFAVGGEAVLVFLPLHAVVIPQAALALIMAVVLGRGAGIITALAVPVVMVLTQVFDLSTMLVGTAGGVAAALAVRRRRRSSALAAGVLVGVVQAVVFEACRVLEGRPQTYAELWSAGEAFGGGLLSGATALVFLPFVEWLLGRSSRGKLKVLTDFDHPLVRELRERAPGTFAHTVNLINMVELAVDAVGGDRLLARAGTLFHDVGKMENPQYFIENQGQGPNLHDDLSPRDSARAILSHVPNGLKIARRHRLPPDVVAFIPEHHGTTGLEFFLHKAREQGGQIAVEEFQYLGPKPQSVETAILMIADSVEAASRTLKEPTVEALEDLVDRIVFKKLSEFQFDECGLTQGDLRRIKGAFVSYLKGALHRRVEYPSQKEEEGEEAGVSTGSE
jgi:putative nucleotidyltransferase with HDIG domain